MENYEVAIVGAGIAGASVAWRLAGRTRVLLLEQEAQPGYHTTGRSAAMFMETYGPPMVRALTRASRFFYENPPAGFSDVPILAERGALYVATHEQAPLLAEMQAELEAGGTTIERIDTEAVLALVPCLRTDQVAGGLYERDARDIDVGALHQGFLRGFRRNGGELKTQARVVAARRERDGWTLSLANGEEAWARTVVDAAGAWADEVAALFGARKVGLVPRRRSAFTFDVPACYVAGAQATHAGPGMDASRWPVVAGIDEGWYFKPDAGRLFGSPANADDTVPHDVAPEELDIATGIWRIEQATTLTIRRPHATWAGLRTFAPDGDLVIGWDAACPGLFWLAGQGGYGIQSAAGASELAATLLMEEKLPESLRREGVELTRVSPSRFARASA